MEKLFVHPECPFSVNTFDLLAKFEENPTSDFYLAHKKDFLKYVEEPVKYILSQVEEQLPDFIKKYINIKCERFGSIIGIENSQLETYSTAFCFKKLYPQQNSQLMLSFDNQKLTFGFYTNNEDSDENVLSYYKYYKNNVDKIEYLKRYHLPNKYFIDLEIDIFNDSIITAFTNKSYTYNTTMQPEKCIYRLLESIISLPVILHSEVKKYTLKDIKVFSALESKEILGYSAKQLIHKIAQTFKKLFPLVLMMSDDADLFINQYLPVYEKEFNPVYHLEEISQITGFQTDQLTQWINAINRKGQTIIQGPPGTGKTFIAERLAKHLIGGGDGFSDIIQFHPAYTYEDFIEGLRPITENGQLTYSIVAGRFLKFCEKAEACEDTCVLIIDEINRANLSQVFGELMYLLDDRQNTERFITLASGKPFRIPTNVRIIGTMNTADRSIALVDNALRRRFAFIAISPNYELLQNYHNREETDFPVDNLIGILKEVNQAINNKHYELGISFFLTETLAEDIQDIWQMEIEPYLEEYFFDNQKKMDEFLWDKIKDKLSK